ncbi:MAG: DUF2164 domain-containing protein [Verrucomicrobiota bacterium]
MHINLTEQKKSDIIEQFQSEFKATFDEDISRFRAETVVEFFIRSLGPPIYNQAIDDARKFIQEKVEDLDATFHQPE